MKTEILLSIIIPAYNVEKYIENALNSIYEQNNSFDKYEVIIVDDESNDNTKHVVKEWIKKNKMSDKVFYHFKKNGNWGSVINYVKNNNLIRGKYFSILDADDYYNDNCFSELSKVIENDYDLVISNFYRKRNNKLINTNVIYSFGSKVIKKNRSFTAWSIPLCKFFKTSIFLKSEDLKENVSYQDQILFHTFVLQSENIFFIKKNLGVYYENREGSSTTLAWNNERIEIWMENMNKLLSLKNKEISSYVMMMTYYCYKNSDNKNDVLISKNNIDIFKQAKFNWLPLGTRILAKTIFLILTRKIVKNSLLIK